MLLSGQGLRLEQVAAVARDDESVSLAAEARSRMAASRATIEALVARGEAVYGVTTGFGDLATVRIAPDDVRRLQQNLVVSHAVGVGPLLDRDAVRAMLLLRANTLARGQSGCRPEVVERLLDFLRLGLHPCVPEQGSVGASGDLAPLAHLAARSSGVAVPRSAGSGSTVPPRWRASASRRSASKRRRAWRCSTAPSR